MKKRRHISFNTSLGKKFQGLLALSSEKSLYNLIVHFAPFSDNMSLVVDHFCELTFNSS